jgi:tyrosyl-tRNA synthetase
LFKFVESHISTLGYTSPSHLLHPTAPLLVPIDFLDSPSDIKKKLKAAYCAEGDVVNNAILPLVRHILVPIGTLLQSQSRSEVRTWAETPESVLTIHGDPNHGGVTRHFSSIEELEKAFEGKEVHPGDLKTAVTAALISLLAPLQLDLSSDAEFKKVEQEAYPPIVKAVKVVKASKKMTPEQEAKKAEVEAMRALQKAEKEKK